MHGDVKVLDGAVLVNDAHAKAGSSGAMRVEGKVQLQPRWERDGCRINTNLGEQCSRGPWLVV